MADSNAPGLGSAPGYFPNDSHMRGKDRQLRRQLPASDGNPRQVPGTFQQVGAGITPESFHPTGVLDAPSGKFGLHHNSGKGP
jgi:hypothetical protein